MLVQISNRLDRLSSRNSILFAIIVYGFFLSTIMPAQSVDSQVYAGNWGSPDGHFFYTPVELYTQLATWSEAGRSDYIDFRLGWDIAWALSYTTFLITITSCALRRGLPSSDRRRQLNLIALFPMCFDYLEERIGHFSSSLVCLYSTQVLPGRRQLSQG